MFFQCPSHFQYCIFFSQKMFSLHQPVHNEFLKKPRTCSICSFPLSYSLLFPPNQNINFINQPWNIFIPQTIPIILSAIRFRMYKCPIYPVMDVLHAFHLSSSTFSHKVIYSFYLKGLSHEN
jgi:hypothetical protein